MICANCGRKLKDSVSIERGLGPICWKKIHGVTRQEKKRGCSPEKSADTVEIPGQMSFKDFPKIMPEVQVEQ